MNSDYVLWTIYWIICALWMFVESTFLWFLVDCFPFFLEIKLVFFLWLMHPNYKGAAYLWHTHIKPLHKQLDNEHYKKFEKCLEIPKMPEAAKTQPVVAS